VVPERDVDCGELYERERQRFLELEQSCDAAARSTMVPATPAWSVHDVLSHVVGIAVDLNAGNFGSGGDPDAWTAARALGGRRTGAEIRALAWRGDAAEIIRRLSRYPLPSESLAEWVPTA
jgi:hypothetical protein